MTNSESEKSTDGATEGIDDEQLPEDLRPAEDNPLAEPLADRDDAHDIEDLDMQGGKTPEESGGDADADDADGDADGDADSRS